jgi:DNA-binding CsgD family transcriptional regulator
MENRTASQRKPRGRISLLKEDRIFELRRQGYDLDTISKIVNASHSATGVAIKRISRRWLYPDDPHCGRQRGFLSDSQIEEIKALRRQGHTYLTIAKKYKLSEQAVGLICRGQTYKEPADCFNYNFGNRLLR